MFAPLPEGLVVENLFDDHVVVAAGKHHPLARSRRLNLADLMKERWILPPSDTEAGHLTAEIFASNGLELPHACVTTLSNHLLLRLLANERMVTIMPGSVLRFGGYEQTLKVLQVRLPIQQRPVGTIMLKNRTLSPVVQVFLDCARKTVGQRAAGART